MSDWLDDIFEEKQKKVEAKQVAEQLQTQRTAKLQALLPGFWKAILTGLYGDLARYNERVDPQDRLDHRRVGGDRFVIEKNSFPPATLMISINSTGERIAVRQELSRPGEKSFTIRLSEAGDVYLEAPWGEPLHESEISQAMLKDFFRTIQGMD